MELVWLKRDLRVADHEPLTEAARRGATACLYMYEPAVLGAAEHDPSHLVFVNECLAEVRERLAAVGGMFLVRRGDAVDVLDRLFAERRFDRLWSHEETGLAATFDRDKRMRAWCRRNGVDWIERVQHGVVRPMRSRDGWARLWSRRMSSEPVAAPRAIDVGGWAGLEQGELVDPAGLGLPASERAEAQRGGASVGWSLLDSFLTERGMGYQKEMSSPVEGARSCSRLSPHLAYGSVSIREAHHAATAQEAELKGERGAEAAAWRKSVASFQKRLRWHCHFIQKFEDEPAIEFRNFNRAYDGLRTEDASEWDDVERQRFAAFESAATGYPMVDACLRCLRATGWINFRMRAMLMSFASYHLWLHWKRPAVTLARLFLDFEPGIHYSQCQMQSGVTGINTVRIYSPIKQAKDQDPTGVFIRRWIPELAGMPDEFLVEPHTAPGLTQSMAGCEIGVDYPRPIVDHAAAYKHARDAVFSVRRTDAAKREAKRVYLKHGSRRRPGERGHKGRPMDDRGGAVDRMER